MKAKQTRDKILQAMNISLEIGHIESLESDCFEKEHPHCCLGGLINILGTMHHVTFSQVKPCKETRFLGIKYEGQRPVSLDSARHYNALVEVDPGGNFQTVRIPGYKGEYVCMITPFHKLEP